MNDRERWLFQPHVNIEFGEVKVRSRFALFVAMNVACAVVRLPLDLALWLLLFSLGHRFGRLLFP